jgi:hypothetical protein
VRDGRGNSEIHFTRLLSQGLVKRSDDFSRPYNATKVATTKSRKRDVSARYSALQGPLPGLPHFRENGGGAPKERWGQKQVAPRDAPSSCKWTGGVFYSALEVQHVRSESYP